MKTRLLVMVGMMISTTIFAQNVTRDSRKQESNGYERMKRELELSDKQYASIKDINSEYSRKRRDEFAKFERRRFEERETMRSLRFEREQEMRKIFTSAQNKKWDEYRAMKKNKHTFRKGKSKYEGRHHKHFRKNKHDRRDARPGMERKG
jgi:periplasmic protein CpxP/Spy